jgi:inorganic pyrophosphatase
MDTHFWAYIDQLVASSSVEIDREQGQPHPQFAESSYPLNYGYLAGTSSIDGGGIDVWVGSGDSRKVTGMLCTVDLLKRETEFKILLGCTEDEMRVIEQFQNQGDQRSMLIRRA